MTDASPTPQAPTADSQDGEQKTHFDNPKVDVAPAADDTRNLDVVLDIPVQLSIEVGRTRLNICDLLQLNQGSVVELDRTVDEPMDVLVNGTLVARGEVVVIDDKFGVRLTDVVSPTERVRKLG